MVEWTVEAIRTRLRKLPRNSGIADAGLAEHAEEIYFAGCWTEYEKPRAAVDALEKARGAVESLGPRARHALTRAIRELRPDPWHHPVDGYMPLPPSPWDPRYQRPLTVDLLLEAFAQAEAAQRAYVEPGPPEKVAANLLARAIVRAWHHITGTSPPTNPYADPAHLFHQLASGLFKLAGRRDSW